MRQLNQTGWMHNRVRMITASFLVKDLRIDWRSGERYFMNHLLDADVAANNGNWQWIASVGTDPGEPELHNSHITHSSHKLLRGPYGQTSAQRGAQLSPGKPGGSET